MEFTAKQIAAFLQGEIVGNENATVHTFAKIEEGVPGAISFLSNPKYTPYIYDTQASIVLVKGTEGTEELKKEIQDYVKKHTAPYKYPRIVVFVDELPKTISGKIMRNRL